MFGLLKKKIVGKMYFLLILTVPVFCSGVIIYNSLSKGIVMSMDNDLENSGEDNSLNTDIIDIDQIESIANFQFNLLHFTLTKHHQNTDYYLLSIYNICLEQKTPPP